MAKTFTQGKPVGYDTAMDFLNKPGVNHQPPTLELNAGSKVTNEAYKTSNSSMGQISGTKATLVNKEPANIGGQALVWGASNPKQVPNSGHSHGAVTTKGKVEKMTLKHQSKSLIF